MVKRRILVSWRSRSSGSVQTGFQTIGVAWLEFMRRVARKLTFMARAQHLCTISIKGSPCPGRRTPSPPCRHRCSPVRQQGGPKEITERPSAQCSRRQPSREVRKENPRARDGTDISCFSLSRQTLRLNKSVYVKIYLYISCRYPKPTAGAVLWPKHCSESKHAVERNFLSSYQPRTSRNSHSRFEQRPVNNPARKRNVHPQIIESTIESTMNSLTSLYKDLAAPLPPSTAVLRRKAKHP